MGMNCRDLISVGRSRTRFAQSREQFRHFLACGLEFSLHLSSRKSQNGRNFGATKLLNLAKNKDLAMTGMQLPGMQQQGLRRPGRNLGRHARNVPQAFAIVLRSVHKEQWSVLTFWWLRSNGPCPDLKPHRPTSR